MVLTCLGHCNLVSIAASNTKTLSFTYGRAPVVSAALITRMRTFNNIMPAAFDTLDTCSDLPTKSNESGRAAR